MPDAETVGREATRRRPSWRPWRDGSCGGRRCACARRPCSRPCRAPGTPRGLAPGRPGRRPSATAASTFLCEVFSDERTALLRSWRTSFCLFRLICDLMLAIRPPSVPVEVRGSSTPTSMHQADPVALGIDDLRVDQPVDACVRPAHPQVVGRPVGVPARCRRDPTPPTDTDPRRPIRQGPSWPAPPTSRARVRRSARARRCRQLA